MPKFEIPLFVDMPIPTKTPKFPVGWLADGKLNY